MEELSLGGLSEKGGSASALPLLEALAKTVKSPAMLAALAKVNGKDGQLPASTRPSDGLPILLGLAEVRRCVTT